jgi:hypothetical protein
VGELAPSGYRKDVVSSAEEQALLKRLEELPFKPFEFHGYLGKRRMVSFGWRYDYDGKTLPTATLSRVSPSASQTRGCARRRLTHESNFWMRQLSVSPS